MCIGCRRNAPVDELVRLSCAPDGSLDLGPGTGRGAWLCAPPDGLACFDQAVKRRVLDKALHTTVSDAELEAVRAKLEHP
jgi:predicted RNA-binding protein YlxR (DUF448 family)